MEEVGRLEKAYEDQSLDTGENNDVVEEMTNLVFDNFDVANDNNTIIQQLMGVTLADNVPTPPSTKVEVSLDPMRVVTFVGDEMARTTDPKKMKRNFRVPLRLAFPLSEYEGWVDEDGVFIMSPEFTADCLAENWKYNIEYFANNNNRNFRCSSRGKARNCVLYQLIEWGGKPSILKRLQAATSMESKKKIKRKDQERKSKKGLKKSRSIVDEADIPDPESTVVAVIKDVGHPVTLRSIKRLAPLQELDDALVDFGILNALKDISDAVYVRTSSWSLYFFTDDDPIMDFRQKSFYRVVTNGGKGGNLLSKKFMFIPVLREAHWFLVIICNPLPSEQLVKWAVDMIKSGSDARQISKTLYGHWITNHIDNPIPSAPMIFVLDSKYQAVKRSVNNWSAFHDSTVSYILKGLRYLHKMHWEEIGSGIVVDEETFKWRHLIWNGEIAQLNAIPHFSLDVPEQRNGKDCGLFVITFVKRWFETMQALQGNYTIMIGQNLSNWFDPDSMIDLRRTMYNVILEHCKTDHSNAVELLVQSNPFPSSTELIKKETEPTSDEKKLYPN